MTVIHELIDDCDIPGLNQYLHMKNVQDLDKPNKDGIFPIEYIVCKFDATKHNIKTFGVLVQTLLNKGFQYDEDMLKEILAEQENPKIKEFIQQVLEMKPNKQKDRFARFENVLPSSFTSRRKEPTSRSIPKSDYSDQELLQLQQAAERNGVIATPVNHLALRIINHLENLLEEYGHFN